MRFRCLSLLSSGKPSNWNLISKNSESTWQETYVHYQYLKNTVSLTAHYSLFPSILKQCSKLQYLDAGICIHGVIIKRGLITYTSIVNTLIDFYIKCNFIDSATRVFQQMENRDSVTWNIMIDGHFDRKELQKGVNLFMQGRIFGFEPNISTLILALHACKNIGLVNDGLNIHGFIFRSGLTTIASLQNSLLSMYAELGDINSARKVFDEMCDRDVISWSAMISGHTECGESHLALKLFTEMCGELEPDGLTIVSVLRACAACRNIYTGKTIHAFVIHGGFFLDVYVGNSLIDMYAKCEDTNSASKVFDEMPRKNMVSWNSIISGLISNKCHFEALKMFNSMINFSVQTDPVTLVNLLHICKKFHAYYWCKSIHSMMIRRMFETNKLLLNSLLDAYAKCELIELAWDLFRLMNERDIFTWSTMISGFSYCGQPDEAMTLFQQMRMAEISPNSVTMLSLLDACSIKAENDRSRWAHCINVKNGWMNDVAIGSAVLNMYAKCGEIEMSRQMFDEMSYKNIVTWSAMISGYGMNGCADQALVLLHQMETLGIEPNNLTMLSILSACCNGGLVEEGRYHFEQMINNQKLRIDSEHYSCMIDLLGRAGEIENAFELINNSPPGIEVGASGWGSLLSACRSYGYHSLGHGAALRVIELEPSNSGGYMLGSNMYAASGMWNEAARMRKLVRDKGVKVVAGYSLVHVNREAHRFISSDRSHCHSESIYAMVECLHDCMKDTTRADFYY